MCSYELHEKLNASFTNLEYELIKYDCYAIRMMEVIVDPKLLLCAHLVEDEQGQIS